jgi:hypothetical protein
MRLSDAVTDLDHDGCGGTRRTRHRRALPVVAGPLADEDPAR